MFRQRAITVLRFLVVACCGVFALTGSRPPASAQSTAAEQAANMHRDDILSAQHDDIAEMKATAQRQWIAIQANANTIAGMQGENRILFGILGLLMGGSITLQLRGKKREG